LAGLTEEDEWRRYDGWPTFTFFVKVGTTDAGSWLFDFENGRVALRTNFDHKTGIASASAF
jgi:hypothetical protein